MRRFFKNIKKIIYAGYATDPLNYEHIDDLIEKSVNFGQVIGIHSKLIKISDRLIKILSSDNIAKTSYLTVSVDGGDDKSYNLAHSLNEKVKVYNRVIDNIKKLNDASASSKNKLDVSFHTFFEGNHFIDFQITEPLIKKIIISSISKLHIKRLQPKI